MKSRGDVRQTEAGDKRGGDEAVSRRQQISPFSLKIPFSPEPSLPLGHALNVSLFCWKSRRFGSEKGTGQSCPRPFPPSDPLCPQRSEGVTPRGTSHGLRRQEVLWLKSQVNVSAKWVSSEASSLGLQRAIFSQAFP